MKLLITFLVACFGCIASLAQSPINSVLNFEFKEPLKGTYTFPNNTNSWLAPLPGISDSVTHFVKPLSGEAWLQIRFANETTQPVTYYVTIPGDSIDVIQKSKDRFSFYRSGLLIPRDQKPVSRFQNLIPVFLAAGEERDLYFHLKETDITGSSFTDTFSIISDKAVRAGEFFNALYVAIMGFLIALGVFLFFMFKDKAFLIMALPVFGLLVWFADTTYLLHQLFNTAPLAAKQFNPRVTSWFMPSTLLVFLAYHLRLLRKLPWAFYLCMALVPVFVIDSIVENALHHEPLYVLSYLLLATIPFAISIAIHLALKKDRNARVWLLFIAPFALSGVWHLFSMLHMVESGVSNLLILRSSSLLSGFIIGYALYDRVMTTVRERIHAIEENERLVREQNIILEHRVNERTLELKQEKEKSENILLNILPAEVADEIKQKGSADAKQYDNVTVLFTDFVNFTKAAEALSPKELVNELHTCFKAFDEIIDKYGIEKIKTIGDAYLAVCGLPLAKGEHAVATVKAAIEIRDFMKTHVQEAMGKSFSIRIGIHSGSVVAGIVGVKKYAYDIWGDTVNTAARMEQSGESGKINISGATYELVKNTFECEYRGKVKAKNKGEIDMYFVS